MQSDNGSSDDSSKTTSDNNDEESKEDKLGNGAEESEEEEIDESVESKGSEESNNTKKKKRKSSKNHHAVSLLTPQTIASLRYYVRNTLFQKIKIIDENHLESNVKIIEDALKVVQISATTTPNLNAYVTECRQIIKRNICSRRGYVKRQIGDQLKGMVNFQIVFFC